jgi:hypothetical protein
MKRFPPLLFILPLLLWVSCENQEIFVGKWTPVGLEKCAASIYKEGFKYFIKFKVYSNPKLPRQNIPSKPRNMISDIVARRCDSSTGKIEEMYRSPKPQKIQFPMFGGNPYYIHQFHDYLAEENLTRKVEIVLTDRDNILINGIHYEKRRAIK